MISQIPLNIFRFLMLLLFQALVFSNINSELSFSPFINIYIFPLFILLLPFETPKWLLILLGFFAGLTLDAILDSWGMHAGACLLIGYLRPYLINFITTKGTEFEISPNVYAQGPTWFVTYVALTLLIYITFYLILESGTFFNPFWLFLKILLSILLSMVFIFLFLYIFSSRKKRKYS